MQTLLKYFSGQGGRRRLRMGMDMRFIFWHRILFKLMWLAGRARVVREWANERWQP